MCDEQSFDCKDPDPLGGGELQGLQQLCSPRVFSSCFLAPSRVVQGPALAPLHSGIRVSA